ncbi:MAG: hypothetical protein H6712_23115 [Myxococcales bacterium]|nr:hypothetical protein [Myxococcales bacterium]MCB9716767.1 hypothetical protein [Myxococcales bacterium]
MAKEPPDFEARRLIERYGPSFHVLRRVLDGLLVVSLIAVLVGATRWPVLLVVVLLRLGLPALYGWIAGRKLGSMVDDSDD